MAGGLVGWMGSGWKGRMAGSRLEGLEGWSWKGSGWKVGKGPPKQEPAQYHFTKEGWRAGRLECRLCPAEDTHKERSCSRSLNNVRS